MSKTLKLVFCAVFFVMLLVPFVFSDFFGGVASEDENRMMSSFPSLVKEDGSVNTKFGDEFEGWINDNIGMRSMFINLNGKIQYKVFGAFPGSSDYFFGPNGVLNYATPAMLKDYQHNNLPSEKEKADYAANMQTISDFVGSYGASFYYYQCWDKHSIYPEYFPDTVLQYGDRSRTDEMVSALEERSGVSVISPKQLLIDSKKDYPVFGLWSDPTHWTPRGAFIAYGQLIDRLSDDLRLPLKKLGEEDYIITVRDCGKTLPGNFHQRDDMELFEVREPKAVLTNEKLTAMSYDYRSAYYTNDSAGNDCMLLIIGDSYFMSYLIDDLAESFRETVFIQADHFTGIAEIMDSYPADIVIFECAERVERSLKVKETAELLRNA